MALPLTILAQTSLKLTVGWTPPAGCEGYEFLRDGHRVSSSFDPAKTQVTFGIPDSKPHTFEVRAIATLASGSVTVNGPAPPPPSTGVAAPGSTGKPVTTLTGQTLPVNLTSPATLEDYIIQGSHDSAVLVQLKAPGSILRRFRIDPCCDLAWTNPYARHGYYMDALNLTAEDFYIRTPGGYQVGQAFSIRFAGTQVRRFDVAGFPFVIGFFQETDDRSSGGHVTPGQVLVEHGKGSFTHPDTAIWIDVDTAPSVVQAFTFRDLHFTGPAPRFVSVSHTTWHGSMTVDSCTLNGQPVTAAMCDVPSGLTVV